MNPVVLHVVRPYESEDEFLEAEAWTIEARVMLLLDQRELEPDTAVVFDVGLTNGVKVMRAEARVVGYVRGEEGDPCGVKVRFRRYGSQTKTFIERAVQLRQAQISREALRASSIPPGASEAAPRPSASPPRRPSAPPPRRSATPPAPAAVLSAEPRSVGAPQEPSGVHRRVVSKVPAPPNRDELLMRLRERAKNLDVSAPSKSGTN